MAAERSDNSPSARGLVIVPAYNEADSIERVVRALHEHLPDFDVLVVDDGSTDGTAHHVPSTARVVTLPFNQGIGGAMQTGYRFAAMHDYDVAVQVDGDGQHPPDQVQHLVDALQQDGANGADGADGVDVVVGSRFLSNGSYRPPASRMLGIRILRGLLRLLTGQAITDCTSGFRAASRRAIDAFALWYPEDYPEPEVILLLKRAGYTVREVGVHMNERTGGTTSIPLLAGVFYVMKVSAALLVDLFRAPWPRRKVASR